MERARESATLSTTLYDAEKEESWHVEAARLSPLRVSAKGT